MAEAKKPPTPPAETDAQPPKKRGKLILIVAGGVLLLLVIAVVAIFFLMGQPAEEEFVDEAEAPPPRAAADPARARPRPDVPPTFVKLDPFVVKLRSEGRENYVQALPELKIYDSAVGNDIKLYMPQIRHKILMLFAGKSAEELATPEGMQLMANRIREAINITLTGRRPNPALEAENENPDGPVVSVFFSSLIVQ